MAKLVYVWSKLEQYNLSTEEEGCNVGWSKLEGVSDLRVFDVGSYEDECMGNEQMKWNVVTSVRERDVVMKARRKKERARYIVCHNILPSVPVLPLLSQLDCLFA